MAAPTRRFSLSSEMDSVILEDADHFPGFLRHSDDDTPVPTWEQVTRNGEPGMAGHVMRLVAGGQEEKADIGGLEHLVVQMQAALLF